MDDGAGESATEASLECEPFFAPNSSPDEPVGLTIRNNRDEGVWVRGYQPSNDALGFRKLVIEVALLGSDEPLLTAPNPCDFTCRGFLIGGDFGVCSASCTNGGGNPGMIYIAPGGVFFESWEGNYLIEGIPPQECWECEVGECLYPVQANVGEYEARAFVAAELECKGEGCTCLPNAEGWCRLEEGDERTQALIDPLTITQAFVLPGELVELVVEP